MIKQTQDQWFNGEYFAANANSSMIFPDFLRLASAFDFNYVSISSEEEMEYKIELCLGNVGPTLCEVFISSIERVVPIVKFGSKIYDMDPAMDLQSSAEFLIE